MSQEPCSPKYQSYNAFVEKFSQVTATSKPPWREQAPKKLHVKAIGTDTGFLISEWQDRMGYWHLQCNCFKFQMPRPGQLPQCKHLIDLLICEQDAKPVLYDRPLQNKLAVPVFFKPGLECYVSHGTGGGALNQVSLVWDATLGHRHTGSVELGYVTQDTGRWFIRDLILEYAVTLWATRREHLKCKAPHHSWGYYEDSRYFDAETDTPSAEVCVDMLDLLFNDVCRRCTEDNGVPNV